MKGITQGLSWSTGGCALLVLAALAPAQTALAHGAVDPTRNIWTLWPISLDIALPSLLVLVVYIAGVRRRQHRIPKATPWRHVSFCIGLAALFVALQSPVDTIAERAYWMHQIQHLLLRMLGPFLIILAAPQAAMTAGLPDTVRQSILVPVIGNRVVRGVFSFFAHPVVATVVFFFTLVFWQLPEYHNLALRSTPLHYLMHISMLLSGLFFWWQMIDFRPRPLAAPFAPRIIMLWISLVANIALGAYLFFKRNVLYSAYDDTSRFWILDSLEDERAGALILWVPGSMMIVIGILIVLRLWLRYDSKLDARSVAGIDVSLAPSDLATSKRLQAEKNRTLALALAMFVLLIAMILITLALIISQTGY